MSSKRKDKNKPVWWPSISRPRAHEETRLALPVLVWVPAGHDDTRRLTMDTGPLRLETGDPRLARLETEGGPHTHTHTHTMDDRSHASTAVLVRADWPMPAASQQRSFLLPLSSVQCSLVSTGCPSIPTDPVLPRRAPRQVNQTKSAWDGLDLAVRGPPRYRKIFQTGSQAVLQHGTRAYLGA